MKYQYLLLAFAITCLNQVQSLGNDIASGVDSNPQLNFNDQDKHLIQLNPINLANDIVAIKPVNHDWEAMDFDYSPKIGDQVEYQITISNLDSKNSLKNISIFSRLPEGMIFVSSSITDDQRANLKILPLHMSDNNIMWRIEEIKSKNQVIIKHISAFLDNSPNKFENKVYAEGTWDTEYASIMAKSQEVSSAINSIEKMSIILKPINVTNTIIAIKNPNQGWKTEDFKSYSPNLLDQIEYQIIVTNMDTINSLKNVSVVSRLPDGMTYISSSIAEDLGGSRQILPSNMGNSEITWRIEEIEPKAHVIIKHVAAFMDNKPRRFVNQVYAEGTWDTKYTSIVDRSQVISSAIPA